MTSARRIIHAWSGFHAGGSIALALAFFLSAPARLSADAYLGVVRTGGSFTWGTVFLLAGLAVAAGGYHSLRSLRVSLILGGLCYFGLAATFTYAAWQFPTANLTAPVVYGWIGACHMLLALTVCGRIAREEREGLL